MTIYVGTIITYVTLYHMLYIFAYLLGWILRKYWTDLLTGFSEWSRFPGEVLLHKENNVFI